MYLSKPRNKRGFTMNIKWSSWWTRVSWKQNEHTIWARTDLIRGSIDALSRKSLPNAQTSVAARVAARVENEHDRLVRALLLPDGDGHGVRDAAPFRLLQVHERLAVLDGIGVRKRSRVDFFFTESDPPGKNSWICAWIITHMHTKH